MTITINGEERALADGTTVGSLVVELGFGARRVAVEINCNVVSRHHYDRRELYAGDVVEIVQFIGGG